MRAGPMKPLKMLYVKISRNCALEGRCHYTMTLNQDIFLRIFPGYSLMGLRKKQGCRKIELIGSKRPIQAGLVGSSATDFLAQWIIWGLTATFLSSVTEETKGIGDKACNY